VHIDRLPLFTRATPIGKPLVVCLLGFSLWGGGAAVRESQALAAPIPIDVLVVAGQSNALGAQSYVKDPTTHQDIFTDATRSPADTAVLLMWAETGVHTSGADPVPLDTLQHLPNAPSPVFGPEVGLARQLYADGDHELLVVKVSYSGTSLAADWQPTRPDFLELVKRVHQALTWAKTRGYAPTIVGFYWMQGEADASKAAWAADYSKNLKLFMKDVRTDLPLGATTPFVIGQIDLADYIAYEQVHGLCTTTTCSAETLWNKEVMNAQDAAASSDVFVAPTSSLPRVNHYIHLSNSSELTLGTSFAVLSAQHLS
jgi:hypothetical protein